MIALLAVVVLVIRYLSLRIDDAKLHFQGFCNCVLVVKRRRLLQLQSVLRANAKHKKMGMDEPTTYIPRALLCSSKTNIYSIKIPLQLVEVSYSIIAFLLTAELNGPERVKWA